MSSAMKDASEEPGSGLCVHARLCIYTREGEPNVSLSLSLSLLFLLWVEKSWKNRRSTVRGSFFALLLASRVCLRSVSKFTLRFTPVDFCYGQVVASLVVRCRLSFRATSRCVFRCRLFKLHGS